MTQRCPAACEMCGAPAHRASRGTGFARATCKCSGQSLVAWQNTVVYYVVLVAGNGHGQAAFAVMLTRALRQADAYAIYRYN